MSIPYTHQPGTVSVPKGEHSWQRRFFGTTDRSEVHATAKAHRNYTTVSAEVFRNAAHDCAELTIQVETPTCSSSTSANFTPSQLRDLAQRLLDAAHDIETNPAAKLAAESRVEVPA